MTKPPIELMEAFGRDKYRAGQAFESGSPSSYRTHCLDADALLAEIRQRLDAMQRDADLVPALMLKIEQLEAQPVAVTPERLKELEANERRYLWIRSQTNCKYSTTFTMPKINTLIGVRPTEDGERSQTYAERFDACVDATMNAIAKQEES